MLITPQSHCQFMSLLKVRKKPVSLVSGNLSVNKFGVDKKKHLMQNKSYKQKGKRGYLQTYRLILAQAVWSLNECFVFFFSVSFCKLYRSFCFHCSGLCSFQLRLQLLHLSVLHSWWQAWRGRESNNFNILVFNFINEKKHVLLWVEVRRTAGQKTGHWWNKNIWLRRTSAVNEETNSDVVRSARLKKL